MENYFVYRFLNSDSSVVYVGKTRQPLEKRMSAHFSGYGHLSREQLAVVDAIEYIDLGSRVEMDIAEIYYINKWKPTLNTQSKYDEDFSLAPRDTDIWEKFDFHINEDDYKETTTKLRVEVVLTESDRDILEFLNENDEPRATQFKSAMRMFMKKQNEESEAMDDRIKRLLVDTLGDTGRINVDYRMALEIERAEKERLASELDMLKSSLRRLAV